MKKIELNNKFIVLLVGISKYTEDLKISNIPNVEQNIVMLKKALTDKQLVGLSESQIIISVNDSAKQVLRKLTDASDKAKSNQYTLFVYFSGHGIISNQDFKLYFPATDTRLKYLESDAISLESIKILLNKSLAGKKIIMLDTCHSGQVHNTMSNMSSRFAVESMNFNGTHFISSSSEEHPSLFPVEFPNLPTFFTGEFLSTLQNGIDNGKNYITLKEVVDQIINNFKEKGNVPVPQQSVYKSIDSLPFAHNRMYYFSKSKRIKTVKLRNENNTLISESAINYLNNITLNDTEQNLWFDVKDSNSIVSLYNFLKLYPESKFSKTAHKLIISIEEEQLWKLCLETNKFDDYMKYRNQYPNGKYIVACNVKIGVIKEQEDEKAIWINAKMVNTVDKYTYFIKRFPNSINKKNALSKIRLLSNNRKNQIHLFFKISLIVFIVMIMTFTVFYSLLINVNETIMIEPIAINNYNNSVSREIVSTNSGYENGTLLSPQQMIDKGELYYADALNMYSEMQIKNPDNIQIEKSKADLETKINYLYDKYLNNALVFIKADDGIETAKMNLKKALILKPGDFDAIMLLNKISE